jgi:hypothetical protein
MPERITGPLRLPRLHHNPISKAEKPTRASAADRGVRPTIKCKPRVGVPRQLRDLQEFFGVAAENLILLFSGEIKTFDHLDGLADV